ncbi:hypothetical protein GRI75_03315 [Altererythrobacter soli]|uniref:Uncharacterized protein n=1 Tax=Croceibacterium soli TaxID=1739690 RepID=A0A6I4UPK7_9SPHN|nr:hypothetical protein [Croceibacterium soli]MXP40678.1 hypothetical protein [Croceibacterium soli]
MKRISRMAAVAALAFTSMLPAGAQAQSRLPDLTGDEAAALAIYAVPALIDATEQACAGRLSSNGFLAKRGPALAQRYAAQQNAVWPKARGAMFKFAAGKAAGEQLRMFSSLPDNAVRPLVDALIRQEAAARVEPKSCTYIERMAEALSPLEPAQAGKIMGVLFDVASASGELAARAGAAVGRP